MEHKRSLLESLPVNCLANPDPADGPSSCFLETANSCSRHDVASKHGVLADLDRDDDGRRDILFPHLFDSRSDHAMAEVGVGHRVRIEEVHHSCSD